MTVKIDKPILIKACGNKPKIIEEYIGNVNTSTNELSIAKMKSPAGWIELGQTPEFDEYTVVLKGILVVETKETKYEIKEREAIIAKANEWIRYSSPYECGAEYIAVCLPAFSPKIVNRD